MSWGDNAGLKPHAALKYECCQILSQGMALGVGDLLHPRGAPDPAVYDLIGSVYRYIERCQEVVAGGRLQSEIAVVVDPELGDRPGPAGLGATRALQQLRLQFDILPPAARLDGYPVVVVLSNTPVDDAFRAALRDYVAGGGSPYAVRNGGARPGGDAVARRAGDRGVRAEPVRQHLPETGARGVRRIGRFRPRPVRVRLPHGTGRRRAVAGPRRGAVLRAVTRPVLRALVHPARPAVALLCDRAQPPGGGRSGDHRIGAAVRRLRPPRRPRAPAADRQLPGAPAAAPAGARAGGAERAGDHGAPKKGAATIVHLLSFVRERRGDLDIVEDALPLVDLPISIRTDRPPKHVELAPHGERLDHEYCDGYVTVRVTLRDGHGMLVCR